MSRSALLRVVVLLGGATAFLLLTWLRRSSGRASAATNADPSIGSLAADKQTLLALRNAGADLTKATEVKLLSLFSDQRGSEFGRRSSRHAFSCALRLIGQRRATRGCAYSPERSFPRRRPCMRKLFA
jgi:hypothetical protein